MKSSLLSVVALLCGCLLLCIPAFAHHGTANYDMTKVITVKGTVTQFDFINPHVQIYLDVKAPDGTMEKWDAEATSPNHLVRKGWNTETFKPGQEITIIGNRAKNGSDLMRLDKIILADGQTYTGL